MDTFGTKFRKLRLLKNLTQEQLVNDFNKKFHYSLTKSAISQYENNKRYPEITALVDFAKYFEISLDFLLSEGKVKNKSLEEDVSNFVIEVDTDVFRIDEYFENFDHRLNISSRIVLNGKAATKKQIAIIKTAIKIGLELSKNNE